MLGRVHRKIFFLWKTQYSVKIVYVLYRQLQPRIDIKLAFFNECPQTNVSNL